MRTLPCIQAFILPLPACTSLAQALQAYPHNPHLLALLLAHGRACRAAARLRRDLAALAAGLAAAAEGDGDAGEDGRSSSSEVGGRLMSMPGCLARTLRHAVMRFAYMCPRQR